MDDIEMSYARQQADLDRRAREREKARQEADWDRFGAAMREGLAASRRAGASPAERRAGAEIAVSCLDEIERAMGEFEGARMRADRLLASRRAQGMAALLAGPGGWRSRPGYGPQARPLMAFGGFGPDRTRVRVF